MGSFLSYKDESISSLGNECDKSTQPKWTELSTYSTQKYEQFIKINNKEYIKIQTNLFQKTYRDIQKYNINTNEWIKWEHTDPINDSKAIITCSAFDVSNQTLYLCTDNPDQIHMINTKTKQYQSYESKNGHVTRPRLLIIHNDCYRLHYSHGFSNFSDIYLSSWDHMMHKFLGTACIKSVSFGAVIVELNYKEMILIIDGKMDLIQSYDVNTRMLTKIDIDFPELISRYGCVAVNNDDYVLMVGGLYVDNNGIDQYHDKIYILDVNKMQIFESKIKSPWMYKEYHCFVMDCDTIYAFNLVFGYIKTKLHDKKIMMKIGMDVMRTIAMFYTQEFLHLIENQKIDMEEIVAGHWIIAVNEILQDFV